MHLFDSWNFCSQTIIKKIDSKHPFSKVIVLSAIGNSSEILLSPYLLHFTIDIYHFMSYSQETTNRECVTAVVVEYTNNRLYMGVLEDDELMFCKSHIGKLDENFKMGKTNTDFSVLNKKDEQKFKENEKQFSILSVKCQIKDHRLIINDERCQEITKEVLHYQQQQQK